MGSQLDFPYALDSSHEVIFIKDRGHRWIAVNRAFCGLFGRERHELLGKSDPDLFPPERAQKNWAIDDEIFATGHAHFSETVIDTPDRGQTVVWTRKYPIRGANGEIEGILAMSTDISDLKRKLLEAEKAEAEYREQRRIIAAQEQVIRALAVPVLEIEDHVLLVPLVGAFDAVRVKQLMETSLSAVVRHAARTVILDVTGLPSIDAEIAGSIVSTVEAISLLGAKTILVGMKAAAARALVNTGSAFGGIRTAARLKQGIALARHA